MKKIKDPILMGVIAGLVGNLLKTTGSLFTEKIGMNQTNYSKMAGSLFMSKKSTKSELGKKVGYLADAAIGAGMGVGYIYVLKLTGKDHALMKGVGYGHGAWTLFMGGANKLGVASMHPLSPKSVLSTYIEHTLYGLGAYLVATKLGDENLFAKEDIEKPVSTINTTMPGRTQNPEKTAFNEEYVH